MSHNPMTQWAAALALGLTASTALAADPPAPAAGPPAKRSLVVVQHRPAKEVADLLGPVFKDTAEFRTVPDSPVNALLIRAAPAAFDDAVQAVQSLDRPRRRATVDVLLVETPPPKDGDKAGAALDPHDLAGPAAEVAARLDELQGKGVVSGVTRLRLSCVEGRPESLLAGEAQAFTMGAFTAAGGQVARSITYRDVGSQAEATVAAADDVVTVHLRFLHSQSAPSEVGPPVGNDEKGKPIAAPAFLRTEWEGTAAVPSGRMRVLTDSAPAPGRGRLLLVIGATANGSEDKTNK